MFKRYVLAIGLMCAPLALFAQQPYPTKPVRMIVPFGPGGGVDNFARPLAQKLTEQLGQQVIVDNRAGASSTIGSGIVASAQPDGYTLLTTFDSPLYISSIILKSVRYDPVKDFAPIMTAATSPNVVVVHPSIGAQSMKDIVDYARKHPGKLGFVTAGAGTQQHLTGESLMLATKTKLVHVAYKGGGQAISDLLGGHVQMGILVLSTVLPHVQSGKLRAVAVTGNRRSKNYPDIPTISESGVPGFAMPDVSLVVMGPAGMPAPLVTRINGELQKALTASDMRTTLDRLGYEPVASTPAQAREHGAKIYALYQRLVKETGLTLD